MQVKIIYPEWSKKAYRTRNRIALLRTVFLFAAYASLLINLCVGGTPWSLIVLGGLATAWVVFIYRPLVENTLIKKMADSGIAICLYLFLLDGLLGGGWSRLAAPIVFFGDLIAMGFYYLVFFKKAKRNFLPLSESVLAGLIAMLCGLVGLSEVNWPLIVIGSVSLGLVVLTLIFFYRPFSLEVKKKFHVK